jgi:hypothetical protein
MIEVLIVKISQMKETIIHNVASQGESGVRRFHMSEEVLDESCHNSDRRNSSNCAVHRSSHGLDSPVRGSDGISHTLRLALHFGSKRFQ